MKWQKILIILIGLWFVFLGLVWLYRLSGIAYAISIVPEGKNAPTRHLGAIERLVACESRNQNIKVIDSNGKWSRGILQFQDATWYAWSKESGITGSPMNRENAKEMAEWAIGRGLIRHWSCAHKDNNGNDPVLKDWAQETLNGRK